jgi:hypothetical protein
MCKFKGYYVESPKLPTVWTVDFDMPVSKLYLLFISANTTKEKDKRDKITAARWCFKVCSQHSFCPHGLFLNFLTQIGEEGGLPCYYVYSTKEREGVICLQKYVA